MAVKDELLRELESRRDQALSGQDLARRLGVSRNAVWKAVTALRREGYVIQAAANKGYCLAADSDLLSEAAIRHHLPEAYRHLHILVLKETDSTNNEAKRLLAAGKSETALVVAETQTAGRGRQGRSFYSPEQSGLYLTLILQPEAGLADALSITTRAAVATVKAIEALTDKKPLIKWVNDLYLDGKKICGILTEAIADFESGAVANVVVGIGVNVGTELFPAELAHTAGSLCPGRPLRNALAAQIAAQLLEAAQDLTDTGYLDFYRSRSLVIGREIIYYQAGQAHGATALGIDDKGGLIVGDGEGNTRILSSGEISLRLAPQEKAGPDWTTT